MSFTVPLVAPQPVRAIHVSIAQSPAQVRQAIPTSPSPPTSLQVEQRPPSTTNISPLASPRLDSTAWHEFFAVVNKLGTHDHQNDAVASPRSSTSVFRIPSASGRRSRNGSISSQGNNSINAPALRRRSSSSASASFFRTASPPMRHLTRNPFVRHHVLTTGDYAGLALKMAEMTTNANSAPGLLIDAPPISTTTVGATITSTQEAPKAEDKAEQLSS